MCLTCCVYSMVNRRMCSLTYSYLIRLQKYHLMYSRGPFQCVIPLAWQHILTHHESWAISTVHTSQMQMKLIKHSNRDLSRIKELNCLFQSIHAILHHSRGGSFFGRTVAIRYILLESPLHNCRAAIVSSWLLTRVSLLLWQNQKALYDTEEN